MRDKWKDSFAAARANDRAEARRTAAEAEVERLREALRRIEGMGGGAGEIAREALRGEA